MRRFWDRVRKVVPDALEPLMPNKAVASSRYFPAPDAAGAKPAADDGADGAGANGSDGGAGDGGDDDMGSGAGADEAKAAEKAKASADDVAAAATIKAKLAEKLEATPMFEWLQEQFPDPRVRVYPRERWCSAVSSATSQWATPAVACARCSSQARMTLFSHALLMHGSRSYTHALTLFQR